MNKFATLFLTLTVMLLFVPVVSATMKINITDFYTANPLASYNVLVSTEDNRSLPYNNADNQTLWLEFDANNQTAPDSSGNGNTGTLTGYSFRTAVLLPTGSSAQPVLTTASWGNAYNFTQNNSFIELSPYIDYNNISFTICAWINPSLSGWVSNINNQSSIFATYPGSSPEVGIRIVWTNSTHYGLEFITRNSSNTQGVTSARIYPFQTEQYVCGVVDRNTNRQTVYVNATNVSTSSIPIATGNITASASTLPRIGYGTSGATTVRQFNGTIGAVRFWSVALNTSQITQEQNSQLPVNGNGLNLSFMFQSNFTNATGNYTYDTNNLVAGQINGSFRFDGINTVVSNATSSVTLTTSGTINYWIKWNKKTTGSNSRPIDKSGNYYMEIIEASNRVDCSFQGLSDNYLVGTGTALTENTWTMISCVYNGTNVSIYKNGVFIIGEPSTGTITSTASTFRIGSEGGTRWYNGSIDDVRIYNTSLSQSQITALYNAGAYRIYNYTSSNGNGTINLPLTNTGAVNMSLTSTANGGYYQSWAINHNTNVDYLNTMAQSTNTFSATQKVTGLTATTSFVTQYLTNSTHYMYVQPYQVNLSNGWYGAFNYTPTALATGSYAYTGAYNWLTNVSAGLIPDIAGQDVTFRFGNTPYTFTESVTTSTNSNIGLVDTVLYNLSINATYPTGSVSIYIPNHNITQGIAIQ